MNKSVAFVLLSFVFLSGFTSCKLLKHPAGKQADIDSISISHAFIGPVYDKPDVATKKDSVLVPVISVEKKMLMDSVLSVWQHPYNYTSFTGKARMHYEEKDNQQEFTAHFRIKKDSLIWINITALGGMVPVARVFITADSIKIVNHLSREAILMPISQAVHLLPVPADFSVLQNFILGQALRNSGTVTNAGNTGDSISIQTEDINYIQGLTYNKSDSTLRSEQMHTHLASGLQSMFEYKKYLLIRSNKFSFVRSVYIQNAGAAYKLEMDFTSADFDQELDYPFSIPGNYTINPGK